MPQDIMFHVVAFYLDHSFKKSAVHTVGCILYSSGDYVETERITNKLRSKKDMLLTTLYFTHMYVNGKKVLFERVMLGYDRDMLYSSLMKETYDIPYQGLLQYQIGGRVHFFCDEPLALRYPYDKLSWQ